MSSPSGNTSRALQREETILKRAACPLVLLSLLLGTNAVSAVGQTFSTTGSDQSGGVSYYLSLQATTSFEPQFSYENDDPEGRYNWATAYGLKPTVSYELSAQSSTTVQPSNWNIDPEGRYEWAAAFDFGTKVDSHDSQDQSKLADDAFLLELRPIGDASTLYLSVTSNSAADETGKYEWADLYSPIPEGTHYSKVAGYRKRPGAVSAVAKEPGHVMRRPLVDHLMLNGSYQSQRPGEAAVLSAMYK